MNNDIFGNQGTVNSIHDIHVRAILQLGLIKILTKDNKKEQALSTGVKS